ncbi:4-hydroxy-tetrahydrodipicolinate synthase [Desertibacillus haloalkaliphilus]|uniref:4-hydroxy-tetrahydrodipicolinate synthase n=1 Tax=Desertibacillus haloalkaliphilus TaxID=1328930 RepID=UPI001C27B3B3|nr:4-hydroxy-tetrahydrodipicolinate synthase [Desertibacillus haloalkaliphilus]MBU8906957.1 4-hydroxy-tetrahydrodipicolinate synthase [Desertibacillus haloalkaliphilus]
MNFGHVLTAMVTPFDQKGNIDFGKAEKLIEHLLVNGTEGFVVAGTTGESPTLSTEEKLSLFRYVVKTVNGRAPVIGGVGSNDTQASVEFTKLATETGIDGVMAVSPYYNKPSQAGLFAHFSAIANATPLPVMIYNIPGRCNVNVSAETMIELAKAENIVSVKEASGDLEQMAAIIENTDDSFTLYSGDDQLTLPALAIGADGIVSVSAHVIGSEMKQMIESFKAGSVAEAAQLHRKLLPIMKSLFVAPNPSPVKAALKQKGVDAGGVRLPMVPLSEAERKVVIDALKATK